MPHRTSFPLVADLVPGEGELRATFITNMGRFEARLLEQVAPNTVSSFVGLASGRGEWVDPGSGEAGSGGYYEGVLIHRVIPGFLIQAGDRTGTGRGSPGYTFDDECSPQLRHDRAGVLSMANAGQFFVTLGPAEHLDDKHTIFGEVLAGMAVVEAIGAVGTSAKDRPIQDVRIEAIEVARAE